MERPRSNLVLILMGLFVSCSDPPRDRTSAPLAADTTGLTALCDSMRLRSLKKDGRFCERALVRFDDQAVAYSAPQLTGRAFQHYRYAMQETSQEFIARFDRLLGPDAPPVLKDWSDYFHGAAAAGRGDMDSCMSVYAPLVERFLAHQDTFGAFTVAYRLNGLKSEMYLNQKDALPGLRHALSLARTVDQRNKIHVELAVAHLLSEELDSTEIHVREMERNSLLLDSLVPNDPWTSGIRRRLRFMLLVRAAMKDSSVPLDTVRHMAKGYKRMMDSEFPWANWNRTKDLLAYAQLLLARGEIQEARAAFLDLERTLDTCANCATDGPGIHAGLARIAEIQGDLPGALRYQRRMQEKERIIHDWKLDERSQKLDHQYRFERMRDSMALAEAVLREKAELASTRSRNQRSTLIAVALLILMLAMFVVNRYRLKRRLQMEQLRTRLSRDLHDDIGSTLSSINILSAVARKRAEAGDSEGAATSLAGITERSERLQRNMSDIVWSMDPNRDSVEDLLTRMREFGASVLEPKGIAFRFEAGEDLPTSLLPEVKSNLYLIFKEAVNNAAKHSGADRVDVAIIVENERWYMRIVDNGKGLPSGSSATNGGGNGLRNMRARAQEIGAVFSSDGSERGGVRVAVEVALE